jgi:hypothetical protein
VENNLFNAAALNALFGTLHNNNPGSNVISISGNEGTSSCNKSIATDKGWRVDI